MLCNKCKHHVKDNLSICPICGSPLKKKKNQKTIKNKYIKEDNSKQVGGIVTDSSSFVNLKKKKVETQIKRSDYNNYLDYQEAVESLKDQELAKVTKYKSKVLDDNSQGHGFLSVIKIEKNRKQNPVNLNDYKNNLARTINPKTGASNGKSKFSKDSAEASIRTKRESDYTKVGNAVKTKRYNSELKSPKSNVNKQDSYSHNGKYFNNIEVSSNLKNVNKESRHFSFLNFLSYLSVMAVWIIVIYVIFLANNQKYYFSDDEGNDISSYTGVSKSNQVAKVSGTGVTSIIYDNQYFKQTAIKSIDDVNKLVVSDSVNQKNSCPTETKKIEDEIIKYYGIVAVNFCEIDSSLAKELRDVIAYVYNEFPSARNFLTNITIANVGVNESYIAAFMPVFTFATSDTSSGYPVGIKTQIILNAKFFLDPIKLKNSVSTGSNNGYFPRNASSSSTVAHEFGHYLSYVAMLKDYNTSKLNYITSKNASMLYSVYKDFNEGNFSYKLLQEAYQDYQREYLSGESFDDFRQSISMYAMARDKKGDYIYDETIAEAFHDCYLNGENAKSASKVIVRVLISKL